MAPDTHTATKSRRATIDDATYLLWRSPTIDVQTTSLLTGVSEQTIYNMARTTGEALPGVKILRVGRRYVVPTSPLRKFLECDTEPAWINDENRRAPS